jgi:succinate dehydrogenase/fumarate reductase flavoprotein subunit
VSFVNTTMQRAQNIEDSIEIFMEDCRKLVKESSAIYGLIWDERLTRIYAERSADMYEILTKRGVVFDRLIKRPLQTSVDRLAAVASTSMFAAAFESDFAGPHVKTYLGCSAHRLLVEERAVVGVRVQPRDGSPAFNVRARKGVILATGGYQANPSLRRRFQPDKPVMGIYPGLPTCRGDGHLLGQALGGDLINMTMIPPIVAVPSQVTESAIAINIKGHRFHDEAGPYLHRVKALEQQEKQVGFYIFDEHVITSKRFYVDQMPGPRISGDTLNELAIQIGVPSAALEDAVLQWNTFLASGKEQEESTGRVQFSDDRLGLSSPPYYASPMIAGVSLTVGGFVTTDTMQVVDVFGNVITGLFAVGDVAGGLTPTAEMGGTHLGGGFVLGWLAGKAVATGQKSSSHSAAPFNQVVDDQKKVSGPIITVAPFSRES